MFRCNKWILERLQNDEHIWSCRTHSGQAWVGVWRRFWSTRWQTCKTQKIQALWKQTHFIIFTDKMEVKTPSVSLVCMCVLSGSDWVFLRKRTAFSFSSFRMRRPRLDWIWTQNTVSCSACTSVRVSDFKTLFFFPPHKLFPALAPAASWPLPSGLQTRPPLAVSSSSTRSLQEFNHIDLEKIFRTLPENWYTTS